MHLSVEADLSRLRTVARENEMATKNLQIQLTGLKEELIFLKKSHEEVRISPSNLCNCITVCDHP